MGLREVKKFLTKLVVLRCFGSLARSIGNLGPVVLFCAAIFMGALPVAAAAAQCQLIDKISGKPFKVFDALLYQDKPNLESLCIDRLNVVYGGVYWPQGATQGDLRLPLKVRVDESAVKASLSEGLSVIDIEHWPVRGEYSLVYASLENYLTVLRWFKAAAPDEVVGYYGVVPIRDYWRADKGSDSAEYREWQAENDKLRPLADAVDVLFPSIYTFYPDREGWKRYAAAQIAESRRLAPGKPVYAFLWPEYHNSNFILKGSNLPPNYWRMELEYLRERADGIVIWGGWQKPWDENAPWWKETKDFLSNSLGRKSVPDSD